MTRSDEFVARYVEADAAFRVALGKDGLSQPLSVVEREIVTELVAARKAWCDFLESNGDSAPNRFCDETEDIRRLLD